MCKIKGFPVYGVLLKYVNLKMIPKNELPIAHSHDIVSVVE